MAKGLNKVMLIGNLGGEVETRSMPNGGSVANFSVATSETWKDKITGEKRTSTEWHNVVAFGKLADICVNWLHKGSKVYIEGSNKTREWVDTNTQKKMYRTEVIAKDMQMLDGAAQQERLNITNEVPAPQPPAAKPAAGPDDFDDDIPF